jgi:hypothetical protein
MHCEAKTSQTNKPTLEALAKCEGYFFMVISKMEQPRTTCAGHGQKFLAETPQNFLYLYFAENSRKQTLKIAL